MSPAENEGRHSVTTLREQGCALIVGLEDYPRIPAWPSLPGAAASAVRFASWLIGREACAADRVTLVTSTRPDEPPDHVPAGVNWEEWNSAHADFRAWIRGPHGPRPKDKLFYIFWVGQALLDLGEDDAPICLITADADEQVLMHLRLDHLLDQVGRLAPESSQLGFIVTRREESLREQPTALGNGRFPYAALKARNQVASPESKRSIVYAATDGKSAVEAGLEYGAFADYLLGQLSRLPADSDTERLVRDFIARLTEGFAARFAAQLEPGAGGLDGMNGDWQ